jgi:endogenous inhibitor of DNA gyrase (YacG/DUF329 family)
MVDPYVWKCPHCGHPQTVTDSNHHYDYSLQSNGGPTKEGVFFVHRSVRCLNPECQKLSLSAWIADQKLVAGIGIRPGKPIHTWHLLPDAASKVQPDFIPQPLRDDYYEACRIRTLSPKSSATLARRCLQGMIRDFCGIVKGRLIDEIQELEKTVNEGRAPKGVTPESVDAIDHVRKIGNIGAHMERDVSQIIDIDPDEAQVLIELLETLFDEWYVDRQARNERLAKIAAIRAEKDALKSGGTS